MRTKNLVTNMKFRIVRVKKTEQFGNNLVNVE